MMKTELQKKAAGNPLGALHDHGQAIWLDFLSRRFIDGSADYDDSLDAVTQELTEHGVKQFADDSTSCSAPSSAGAAADL